MRIYAAAFAKLDGGVEAQSAALLLESVAGDAVFHQHGADLLFKELLTLPIGDDGTFSTPLQLSAGRWSIIVTATGANKSYSLTRHVSVAFKGVNLVVAVKGSPAWIKVLVDGKLSSVTGGAGKTYQPGKTIAFTGSKSIEVRSGSSGATFFTLNGQSIGALGKRGVPETWLFQPPDSPKKTQHQ